MKKRILISIFVITIIAIFSILFRIHYVNQTRGRCLHPTGGCDPETNLCTDYTIKCDFKESITYYFFK